MIFLRTLFFIVLLTRTVSAQSLYFPPVSGNSWDTLSPLALGWCPDKIDTLSQYLQDKNTKAFIVLKDGKIAIEEYFGTFTVDSLWYWASAGKSLAAFLTGIAQEEGLFSIADTVSGYLGNGWTSCSPAEEAKISIRHMLTMTSGLDDDVPDPDCTADTCLVCIDTAGGRWAYHNAPYRLLHSVIENASGTTMNFYTYSKLAFSTGITGGWIDHVFYSKARMMARFGLLSLAGGVWDGDTILHDQAYISQMISSSQNINPAYGYLWWLNGKGSYMLPQSQLVFPGDIVPNAPSDMYAALGKNDQKIYVVPSLNLVVVRMGENSGTIPFLALSSFDNVLWQKLNDVFCGTLSQEEPQPSRLTIHPNPSTGVFNVSGTFPGEFDTILLYDRFGRLIDSRPHADNQLDLSLYPNGIYLLRFIQSNPPSTVTKVVVLRK